MTNSYGYNEITLKILQNIVHYFISPLLATGIFLDRLQFSEIKPLYI
jgi:hypothetical protein